MTPTEVLASLLAICSVHTCYIHEESGYMQIDAAPPTSHPDDTMRFHYKDELIVIVPKGDLI